MLQYIEAYKKKDISPTVMLAISNMLLGTLFMEILNEFKKNRQTILSDQYLWRM